MIEPNYNSPFSRGIKNGKPKDVFAKAEVTQSDFAFDIPIISEFSWIVTSSYKSDIKYSKDVRSATTVNIGRCVIYFTDGRKEIANLTDISILIYDQETREWFYVGNLPFVDSSTLVKTATECW